MTERRAREPLDALRGIAALGLALGSWLMLTIWRDVQFIGNLHLLADFVIVIAGFIVARAHSEALTDHRRIGRFAISRIVRFAPLHVAGIAAFLLIDSIARLISGAGLLDDLAVFAANLLFMQIFMHPDYGWNPLAWIVAAELFMSVMFAFACTAGAMARRLSRLVLWGLVCAIILVRMFDLVSLSPVADLLLRMTAAFFAGALVFGAISSERISTGMKRLKKNYGGLVEAWVLLSTLGFVWMSTGNLGAVAPWVFAICLIVFLRRKAAFAYFLSGPLLQRFGDLSYPIIMVHFVLVYPAAFLTLNYGFDLLAVPLTLLTPLYLLLVLALSELAVQFIEYPTRRAMWAWLDRAFPDQSRASA
ncbi:MAG: acyltransferase family protein [Pseudomonadota bacterium]